ncbi:MAG: OPT/YSL family transporter, partial [Coriobacteriales bacterium]|nr:OPT/YSL family transporter [Coriobacteriales bacterium]
MSTKGSRAKGAGLSAAGIAIGVIGCVIITASSVYTALKMGALPWPTIFTSITALVLLRALGHRSLNEANVTQIIMSAGSMVAGGLAFTIPGIWMLGLSDEVSWVQMLLVALCGTLLGLVCTALIRKRFVESDLEYPIGVAAAETLTASQAGGATGRKLFGSMALAGLWSLARDVFGIIPAMLFALPIPGVSFGIYNSPMMLSVGFLVGGSAMAFWFGGALLA